MTKRILIKNFYDILRWYDDLSKEEINYLIKDRVETGQIFIHSKEELELI